MLKRIYSIIVTILLFLILIFNLYFYLMKYRPMRFVVSELQKENQSLIVMLQSEREDCRKKLLEMVNATPDSLQDTASVADSDTVSAYDTLSMFETNGRIAFPIAILFKGDSAELSEKGRKLIKQAWEEINRAPFKELLVLISEGRTPEANDKRAQQALAVKSYFIELGAPKEKVWAWVRNDVDYGVLELRVKR